MKRRHFFICTGIFLVVLTLPLTAQSGTETMETGDAAMAGKYVQWALEAMEAGHMVEAEEALERASVFRDVSSDVSYLLALVRMRREKPLGSVLEAISLARKTKGWHVYNEAEAAKLEAQALIILRSFEEALAVLAPFPEDADLSYLRLQALEGLPDHRLLLAHYKHVLDAYPLDPRFAHYLFSILSRRQPKEGELELVNLLLHRLPSLSHLDPQLNHLAAPFVRDVEERGRLVAAYRALYPAAPAAIIQALDLGLVDERTAVDEYFALSEGVLPEYDIRLLKKFWELLRHDEGRGYFSETFGKQNCIVTEDVDGDGTPESRVWYEQGLPLRYLYDADQDRLPEADLAFQDGIPYSGVFILSSENPYMAFARPRAMEERDLVRIYWERYPAVLRAETDHMVFILRPRDLKIAPLQLTTVFDSFSYPKRETLQARVTTRSLISFSTTIERSGTSVSGSVEYIELIKGIPQRSVEIYNGQLLSRTEYKLGRPIRQYADVDMDGILETFRLFRSSSQESWAFDYSSEPDYTLEYLESDWNGDGVPDYGEKYYDDGTLERFWDTNGDGSWDVYE